MKGALKFVIYALLVIVLAIGGILLYQAYGISDKTNWDEKDEIELQQEQNADSVVNSVDIFD